MAECTGCTESLIRTADPWAADLILDIIDLAYHETVMAAAGEQAEHILEETIKKNKGKYICIVDGAIPTKDNGAYGRVGGKTMMEIVNNGAKNAAAVIAVGNCAAYGGLPAAKPNPTEAKSVKEVTGVTTVNLAVAAQRRQYGGDDCSFPPAGKTPCAGCQGPTVVCLWPTHSRQL
jgi:NiFe hydrogenase small subunit HydA